MQPQTEHNPPKPALPYEALTFILTQTIGLEKQQLPQQTDESIKGIQLDHQYKYRDIVVPYSLGSVDNAFVYYMFHVGSVYNWLRNINTLGNKTIYQRHMLSKYLKNKIIQVNTNTKDTQLHPNNKKINNQLKINSNIRRRLHQASRKYQIVKKSLLPRLILTKIQNRNKFNSQIVAVCKHALKIGIYATDYTYNPHQFSLIPLKYYCKECQADITISTKQYTYQYNLKEYPCAPCFTHYYGQTFQVKYNNKNHVGRFKYCISQIYTDQYILIKAANKIWYKAQIQSDATIGNMHICANIHTYLQTFKRNSIKNEQKQLYIYVHQDMDKNCGVLRMAQPLPKQQKAKSMDKSFHEQIQKAYQHQQRYDQPKPLQRKQPKHKNSIPKQIPNKQMQQELQQITQNAYNPRNNIVLPSNLGPSAQKYAEQIDKLYIRPKVKDQYEIQYDKGKTKKIRKKNQYIKPDFNQLFKQVKKDNQDKINGVFVDTSQQFQKRKRDRDRRDKQRNQQNANGRNNGRGGFRRGRGGFRGGRGGRQASKLWKKQKKQQFIKKFQQS